uniref:(California timema) hypothetical protein n=1 Tax=Timema californicum TaxID=61474 RepID=A0A7R9P6J6_TIMCA|nr:unnamed protein product [Timema californicum]
MGSPDQNLNLVLPVIGSLVYCDSSALDHVANEAGSERAFTWRESGKQFRKNHPKIRTSISPSSAVELNTTSATPDQDLNPDFSVTNKLDKMNDAFFCVLIGEDAVVADKTSRSFCTLLLVCSRVVCVLFQELLEGLSQATPTLDEHSMFSSSGSLSPATSDLEHDHREGDVGFNCSLACADLRGSGPWGRASYGHAVSRFRVHVLDHGRLYKYALVVESLLLHAQWAYLINRLPKGKREDREVGLVSRTKFRLPPWASHWYGLTSE